MLSYIKRNYKEQSRLPLDLKTPRFSFPYYMYCNYTDIEYLNAESDVINYEIMRKVSKFRRNVYMKSKILLQKMKYTNFKEIKTGSLICICMVPRTFFLNLDKLRFREEKYDIDNTGFVSRYKIFIGHCIWKRIKQKTASVLIRSHLLDVKFFYRFQLYAPNIITVFNIKKQLSKKVGKYKEMKLKFFEKMRRITYSRTFKYSKKTLPSFLSKLRNQIYPRLKLSTKVRSRKSRRKKNK